MAEYIERGAAIQAAKHAWAKGIEPSQYIEIITAADVAPVVHGRWVHDPNYESWAERYICSICDRNALTDGDYRHELSNYCPNCGAKMDLEG